MIYIGIDIAKFTHFASAVNSDGEVLVKPFSFENSRKGFDLFLSKIKNFDNLFIFCLMKIIKLD